MFRPLIAAATAVSLALSPLAASDAAAFDRSDRDAMRLLLGAVALGLIFNEAVKDDDRSGRVYRHSPAPLYRHDNRRTDRVIPRSCIDRVHTHEGRRDVVSGQCMADHGLARTLPRSCAFEIRGHGGRHLVYGESCLLRKGFRIARAGF